MFERIRLQNFKSFEDATLELGPLTTIIGTNGSGKSNLRDAFRFLHGLGRGYSLPEVLGEKWEASEQKWAGIRGGSRHVVYRGADTFAIEVLCRTSASDEAARLYSHRIQVEVPNAGPLHAPRVAVEHLEVDGETAVVTEPSGRRGLIGFRTVAPGAESVAYASAADSLLNQESTALGPPSVGQAVRTLSSAYRRIRFFDLLPSALQNATAVGLTTLGERGDNLPSVLFDLNSNAGLHPVILSWLAGLMPMEVADLHFEPDANGRIGLWLVDPDGWRCPPEAASEGTLRFLGLLAIVFGASEGTLLFIEEPENGIHPTRIALIAQLLQFAAKERGLQVVVTTHSPLFLQYLDPDVALDAVLAYRHEGSLATGLKCVRQLPEAERLFREKGPLPLHESGWFETSVEFLSDPEPRR